MITGGVPTRFAHDLTDQNMRCSWLVRSLISKKMKKWSPAPLPHLTSDVFFHNRFNRLLLPSGNLTQLLKKTHLQLIFPLKMVIFYSYVNVYQRVSKSKKNQGLGIFALEDMDEASTQINGDSRIQQMEIRQLYMFGHILWGSPLKFRPKKQALYMVGTSNLGS